MEKRKGLNDMDLLKTELLELPLHEQMLVKRTLEGKLSQAELGEKLGGLTQIQVSAVERGKIAIPKECRANVIRYLYQEEGDENGK